MKPKFYWCELWRMNFHFFLGWHRDDFIGYVEKNYGEGLLTLPGLASGKTLYLENKKAEHEAILIWVKYKGKKGFSTLAHECVHAANWVLRDRGVQPDFDNDEPQCYLVGNLVRQALGVE